MTNKQTAAFVAIGCLLSAAVGAEIGRREQSQTSIHGMAGLYSIMLHRSAQAKQELDQGRPERAVVVLDATLKILSRSSSDILPHIRDDAAKSELKEALEVATKSPSEMPSQAAPK